VIGVITYQTVVRPARRRSEFVTVMLTFGLFELFNGLSNSLWSPTPRLYPAPWTGVPFTIGKIFIERQSVADAAISLVVMLALAAWLRFTRAGLGIRATTDNAYAAQVVGMNVTRVYATGWAAASAIGAVAGMLLANTLLLSPDEMANVFVFSLVALIIGGLESPVGAVVGGLVVGVVDGVLSGTQAIGPNLATPVMLAVMIVLLLVRPQGLFGQLKVRKL
jgi:branched-chain amino acid transport system permease protein